MTIICLMRHGETDWNSQKRLQGRENIELNNKGRAQALNCGRFLKKYKWDGIVTSTLSRAVETAELIGLSLGISKVIKMEDFIERDFGVASGMTYEEKSIKYPNNNIPFMEKKEIVTARVMGALDRTVRLYPDKRIIIITHGAVIHCIVSAITKGKVGSDKAMLKNACINMINHNEGKYSLELYNTTVEELEESEDKDSEPYFFSEVSEVDA